MGFNHNRKVIMDIILIILTILSVSLGFTDSTSTSKISCYEGDLAEIVFQYTDLIVPFAYQLQMGNEPPFHISLNLVNGRKSNPNERLHIEEVISGTNEQLHMFNVSITLSIENVRREDVQTFICTVFSKLKLQKHIQKVGLTIEFPTGQAVCVVDEGSATEMNKEWIQINCEAELGSQLGFFECYQQGKIMPQVNMPNMDMQRGTLQQTILIRRDELVFCCSSEFDNRPDMCNCTDFGWDPTRGNIPAHEINPCFLTAATQRGSSTRISGGNVDSHSLASKNTFHTTPESISQSYNFENYTVVWTVISLMFTVIIALVLLLNQYRKLYLDIKKKHLGGQRKRQTSQESENPSNKTDNNCIKRINSGDTKKNTPDKPDKEHTAHESSIYSTEDMTGKTVKKLKQHVKQRQVPQVTRSLDFEPATGQLHQVTILPNNKNNNKNNNVATL